MITMISIELHYTTDRVNILYFIVNYCDYFHLTILYTSYSDKWNPWTFSTNLNKHNIYINNIENKTHTHIYSKLYRYMIQITNKL